MEHWWGYQGYQVTIDKSTWCTSIPSERLVFDLCANLSTTFRCSYLQLKPLLIFTSKRFSLIPSDLLQVNLISCKMILQLFYHHLLLQPFVAFILTVIRYIASKKLEMTSFPWKFMWLLNWNFLYVYFGPLSIKYQICKWLHLILIYI